MTIRPRIIVLSIGMALSMAAQAQHASPHDAHGADAGCTTEHAAMGHCTMPEAGARDHAGHDDHAAPPDCTPGHAAMGHCTMPRSSAPAEPLTPVPPVTDADRAAAFPDLHQHSMQHPSPVTAKVSFERLEAWDTDQGTGQHWQANAWFGGDIHRLWLRGEGQRLGSRTGSSNIEALYGRSVTPWWDLVAGVRQDTHPASRTWAAFGVQGLAPYLFEVSATAYVGSGGQVQVKAEAEYDVRFTNRIVLQPVVEATASLTDEPAAGIGSGLNKVEASLRLRYEISRRFAPYIGVVHERAFGDAARTRLPASHSRDTRVVAGVRIWF